MTGTTSADGGDVLRRPEEEWKEYMNRLEKAHFQSIGDHRLKEAEALEKVAEQLPVDEADPKTDEDKIRTGLLLRVEARAKRRYAQEFFDAVEEMERGADS